MLRTKNSKMVVALAILALVVALPALAHGRRGPGRPGAPRGLHSGGVLAQLIFPCQADCSDTARS